MTEPGEPEKKDEAAVKKPGLKFTKLEENPSAPAQSPDQGAQETKAEKNASSEKSASAPTEPTAPVKESAPVEVHAAEQAQVDKKSGPHVILNEVEKQAEPPSLAEVAHEPPEPEAPHLDIPPSSPVLEELMSESMKKLDEVLKRFKDKGL